MEKNSIWYLRLSLKKLVVFLGDHIVDHEKQNVLKC